MKKNPLISVVVPVYNKEIAHLEKCFNSVINQSYKNFELIIVDDGSKKEVADFCNEFGKKDNRIKVFHKRNGGVSSARNLGIEKVSGQYITFLDADDWLELDFLKKSNDILLSNDADVICWSYYKNYSKNVVKKTVFGEPALIECGDGTDFNYYNLEIIGSACAKIYKRDFVKDFRFDELLKNGEDVEFNFRLFKKIRILYGANGWIYHYRILDDSAVRNNNVKKLSNYKLTLSRIERELDWDNDYQLSAYYTFAAVALLLLSIDVVLESKDYLQKRKEILLLKNEQYFSEAFKNCNFVRLPISRKLPFLMLKYNCIIFFFAAVWLKRKIDD